MPDEQWFPASCGWLFPRGTLEILMEPWKLLQDSSKYFFLNRISIFNWKTSQQTILQTGKFNAPSSVCPYHLSFSFNGETFQFIFVHLAFNVDTTLDRGKTPTFL